MFLFHFLCNLQAPSEDWKDNLVVFNPHSWTKSEVVTFPPQMGYLIKSGENIQIAKNGQILGKIIMQLCVGLNTTFLLTTQAQQTHDLLVVLSGFQKSKKGWNFRFHFSGPKNSWNLVYYVQFYKVWYFHLNNFAIQDFVFDELVNGHFIIRSWRVQGILLSSRA